ncbi:GNAT family N-acetyltransferase [Rhizobium lentis]|uniref:Phosphinothricin acetyltransferase n=1 Tax=Rhizobium lentis TaxID=1138194 RepID=A0A7W8XLA1_9HYPH|nr:GNAT family N-acetyltransferase [Rhizobium lentis]MBB4577661.1 phosphinothricin acetyltransferase [Rhizobium lentis]MBB5554219.1 phosphinothricin acetyltransferase [Rhizobium lentis]MBB5564850.1 phosphinothricin acetyltransferase [Rhizobium lentis]MBB5571361.1 phosphinothricin acetyltransferase [Rhizobium lentis]
MSYQIRPLGTGDLPSVTNIYNAACCAGESTQGTRPWSIKKMREFLFEARPSFETYICVDNDAVVGWTALTRFRVAENARHTAEMSLYVQETFRRNGIGSTLAQTVLNRASVLDLHCIFAMVFKDAPGVISFAKTKCGFSVAGCLPEIFYDRGKHYDVLVLEKLVSSPLRF